MNIIIPSKKIYSKDYSNIVDNQAKSISITVNDVESETTQKSFAKERVSELDDVTFPKDNLPEEYSLTNVLNWSLEYTNSQEDSAPERYITWCSTKPYYKTVKLKVKKADIDGSTIPDSFSITSTKNAIKRTYAILGGEFAFATIAGTVTDRIIQSVSFNGLSGIISNESVTNIPLTYQSPVYNNSTYGKTKTVTEPIHYENFDEEHYLITINILYAIGVITIGQPLKYNTSSNVKYNIEKGTLEEYRAYSINFELLGNVYTLNTKDDTITLTSGTVDGTDIVLQSNNLMQGKYKEAFEENARKTLEAYQNGKENATIQCSIGDYYDTSGGRAISTQSADKMTFNLYDNVIPMVRNRYGLDSPFSLSPDGKPKVFSVLGSKVFFDGAVWQELTLQEFGTANYQLSDGTPDLYYWLGVDEEYALSDYNHTQEKNIVIAKNVNGYPVRDIFVNQYSSGLYEDIDTLTIPNTITRILGIGGAISVRDIIFETDSKLEYIGDMAFQYVQKLSEIKIPNSVITIGYGAFEECLDLTSVTLPNKLGAISENLFYNCENLKNVKIPKSVMYIEKNAFGNCFNLTDIYFEGSSYDWVYDMTIAEEGNEILQQANIHFNVKFYE